MSTAKRRINFTGRKRIRREEISIRLLESRRGEPLRAKATLSLEDHGFPASAAIAIEAYHRSTGMRFDCGTVGKPAIPEALVLDEVDQGGNLLFRVKIIATEGDSGRILGSAERISPTSDDDDENKRALFPVLYRSLGEEVWKVDVAYEERPALVLNREIPGIRHRLKTDALLQGLLFPAAFRVVLENLARDDDEGDDEEEGWRAEWLQFCRERLGIDDEPPPKTSQEQDDWIDYAVQRFCQEYGFMKGIRKLEEAPE